MADGYPRITWDQPTRRSTVRGWLERHEAHRMLAWEAYPAGADDYDDRGIPVAAGAVVLVWHAGGEQVQTTHDDIDAAKAHAEATLRMRGML